MKVGVIVNPAAGGGRLRQVWPEAEAALGRRFGQLCIAFTKMQGEGRALATRFVRDGCDILIAAGGDGTVSEVVDGLLGSGSKAAERVDLGIVPVGTGADLGRALGFNSDFDAIATAIAERPARTIDAGLMEYRQRDGSTVRRHFVNIASLGISADIAMAVNASRKRLLPGKLLFAWHAIKEIVRYHAPGLVVRVDGEEVFCGKAPLVAVANNHSFAGGMMIAPDARLDDGLLNVVVVRDAGRSRLIGALRRVYDGSHRTLDICRFHSGTEVEVEATAGPVGLEADGEVAGFAPARFRVLPGAVRIRG